MSRRALVSLTLLSACADAAEPPVTGLPFVFERPAKGEPLTAAEVSTFTGELTSFWRDTKYFEWVASVSHGVDASSGKPDFLLWWHDVELVKEGDTVTYRHAMTGGGHNIYIPSSRVLEAAAAGYLLTKSPAMARLTEQFAKGVEAACRGFVHDASDPNRSLMARNFVGQNHTYTLPDGRKAAVDFSPWYSSYEGWNAQRFEFANNPDWGDVWVTNMRSKDDVPHIYLAAWVLDALVATSGVDPKVKAAAEQGLACVRGFAKDVVDSGYLIRTKDAEGRAYVPDQDLASFVQYDSIDPKGECAAKLTSALLAYGEPRGNDCGRNARTDYEAFAVAAHFYNYAIVHGFHLTAALGALMRGQVPAAQALLAGLAERTSRYMDPSGGEVGRDDEAWGQEISTWLIQAASVGLPLTAEEVRFVHDNFRRSLAAHRAWDRWDLWASSVPDGVYAGNGGYLPPTAGGLVHAEDLGLFLHYCWSPYRNAAGQPLVDCARVAAPAEW